MISLVSYFTINPYCCHRYPANIAKTTFKGQNLSDSVYIGGAFCKVKAYIPSPFSAKTAEGLGIQENTVDPSHIVLSVSHLTIPIQAATQQNASVQTALKNMYFELVPPYIFKSEVAALGFKHSLKVRTVTISYCVAG